MQNDPRQRLVRDLQVIVHEHEIIAAGLASVLELGFGRVQPSSDGRVGFGASTRQAFFQGRNGGRGEKDVERVELGLLD